MRTSRLVTRALAAALVSASSLAACGSTGTNGVAGKPTGQIITTAEAAVAGADSVHVQGDLGSGANLIHLDMRLVKGKGASGTVVIDNQTIELLRVGQDVYVKGDAKFYLSVINGLGATPAPSGSPSPSATGSATPTAPASTAPGDVTLKAMQGNFLHIGPSDTSYQVYASLTDAKSLVDQILTNTGSLSKDGQKDIRGSKTLVLNGSTGNSRVYVGIDGPAYLLRVLPAGGGTLDFLDYGSPVALNAPPANQVVEIGKIPK